jgi:hypothetical protein
MCQNQWWQQLMLPSWQVVVMCRCCNKSNKRGWGMTTSPLCLFLVEHSWQQCSNKKKWQGVPLLLIIFVVNLICYNNMNKQANWGGGFLPSYLWLCGCFWARTSSNNMNYRKKKRKKKKRGKEKEREKKWLKEKTTKARTKKKTWGVIVHLLFELAWTC